MMTDKIYDFPHPCGAFITNKDLDTLKPLGWVDGQIISAVLYDICVNYPDVGAQSPYLYQELGSGTDCSKWKVSTLTKDIILVPIHSGNHWSLVVMQLSTKIMIHLDSKENHHHTLDIGQKLSRWIDVGNWKVIKAGCPQQVNSDDCGIFVCAFADYFARY